MYVDCTRLVRTALMIGLLAGAVLVILGAALFRTVWPHRTQEIP